MDKTDTDKVRAYTSTTSNLDGQNSLFLWLVFLLPVSFVVQTTFSRQLYTCAEHFHADKRPKCAGMYRRQELPVGKHVEFVPRPTPNDIEGCIVLLGCAPLADCCVFHPAHVHEARFDEARTAAVDSKCE